MLKVVEAFDYATIAERDGRCRGSGAQARRGQAHICRSGRLRPIRRDGRPEGWRRQRSGEGEQPAAQLLVHLPRAEIRLHPSRRSSTTPAQRVRASAQIRLIDDGIRASLERLFSPRTAIQGACRQRWLRTNDGRSLPHAA